MDASTWRCGVTCGLLRAPAEAPCALTIKFIMDISASCQEVEAHWHDAFKLT